MSLYVFRCAVQNLFFRGPGGGPPRFRRPGDTPRCPPGSAVAGVVFWHQPCPFVPAWNPTALVFFGAAVVGVLFAAVEGSGAVATCGRPAGSPASENRAPEKDGPEPIPEADLLGPVRTATPNRHGGPTGNSQADRQDVRSTKAQETLGLCAAGRVLRLRGEGVS